jgi:hypothetical protein
LTENDVVSSFLKRCEQWLCDGYSSDIRYIATATQDGPTLFDAAVLLNPLPHTLAHPLSLALPTLLAGQEQTARVPKEQLLDIVRRAVSGTIRVGGQELALPKEGSYRYQPAAMDQTTWFMPLTLQLHGLVASTLADPGSVDNALRAATPPFDGLEDLRTWLGLRQLDGNSLSTIAVIVNPPVDLRVDYSQLSGGILRLVLNAHPKADRSQVRIAVRAVPGDGLHGRLQIADRIAWADAADDRIEGKVEVALPNATGALAMLLIGPDTVRRNWFLDPAKAPNHRFAATQHFDSDLRMIRQGLFESPDPSRFEAAVAALLFLLGFSPSVQLETNSPDLVVATPHGRLILVECTTRVADVATKMGKLVDRRGALLRTLREDNHGAEVAAALVCRVPRDQIAVQADAIKAMGIVLATAEDLTDGLTRARLPVDPDDILAQALRALAS